MNLNHRNDIENFFTSPMRIYKSGFLCINKSIYLVYMLLLKKRNPDIYLCIENVESSYLMMI